MGFIYYDGVVFFVSSFRGTKRAITPLTGRSSTKMKNAVAQTRHMIFLDSLYIYIYLQFPMKLLTSDSLFDFCIRGFLYFYSILYFLKR